MLRPLDKSAWIQLQRKIPELLTDPGIIAVCFRDRDATAAGSLTIVLPFGQHDTHCQNLPGFVEVILAARLRCRELSDLEILPWLIRVKLDTCRLQLPVQSKKEGA
ncbi:MAG: hypothetical protein JJ916_08900 [Phycisphaerales bacterium]|nr:hypothetical protein [Phycisphaerales bacterium]